MTTAAFMLTLVLSWLIFVELYMFISYIYVNRIDITLLINLVLTALYIFDRMCMYSFIIHRYCSIFFTILLYFIYFICFSIYYIDF